MKVLEITEEQMNNAIDEAYKKAGHNAYFSNGFEAGVKFAQEKLKDAIDDIFSKLDMSKVMSVESKDICPNKDTCINFIKSECFVKTPLKYGCYRKKIKQ